jgi:hypothetical protein
MKRRVDDDDDIDDGGNAWARSTTVPDGGRVRVPLNLTDGVQKEIAAMATGLEQYQKGYRFVSDADWDDAYAKARAMADQSREEYIRQISAGREANDPNRPANRYSDDEIWEIAVKIAPLFALHPPVRTMRNYQYSINTPYPTPAALRPGSTYGQTPAANMEPSKKGPPPYKSAQEFLSRNKDNPMDAESLQAIRDASYQASIALLHAQHPSHRRRLS